MRNLKRMLAAILMTLVIGFGAFAQKNDNSERPRKEDNKVKVRDKGGDRQPRNNQGNNNNDNRRRKPD